MSKRWAGFIVACSILMLINPALGEVSIDQESVHSMLNGPMGRQALQLRLISIIEGERQPPVTLQVIQVREGQRKSISWKLPSKQAYCVACDPDGHMHRCESGSELPDPTTTIAETGVAWQVFTDGICASTIRREPDQTTASGEILAVFDILKRDQGAESLPVSRIYFSSQSGLPVTIERYDQYQNIDARIEVVNARHMMWGPVITAFKYRYLSGNSELQVQIKPGATKIEALDLLQ